METASLDNNLERMKPANIIVKDVMWMHDSDFAIESKNSNLSQNAKPVPVMPEASVCEAMDHNNPHLVHAEQLSDVMKMHDSNFGSETQHSNVSLSIRPDPSMTERSICEATQLDKNIINGPQDSVAIQGNNLYFHDDSDMFFNALHPPMKRSRLSIDHHLIEESTLPGTFKKSALEENNEEEGTTTNSFLIVSLPKAWSLVEVISKFQFLVETTDIKPYRPKDFVRLAEQFVIQQHEFASQGRKSNVTIGYHYTREYLLDGIQNHGLMSYAERRSVNINSGGTGYFGDGIYTANNPHAFCGSFGPVGLIVAVLRGRETRVTKREQVEGVDTRVGNKRYHREAGEYPEEPLYRDEIVLQRSSQILPLLTFPMQLGQGGTETPSADRLWELHTQAQAMFDDFFQVETPTAVVRVTPPSSFRQRQRRKRYRPTTGEMLLPVSTPLIPKVGNSLSLSTSVTLENILGNGIPPLPYLGPKPPPPVAGMTKAILDGPSHSQTLSPDPSTADIQQLAAWLFGSTQDSAQLTLASTSVT